VRAHKLYDFILSDVRRQRQQHSGSNNIICRCQAPHAQAQELHFALCVVVRQQQHTTVQAISHRAQAHKLFILAMTAKNVDDEALVRKRTMHELSAHAHKSISHHAQAHELSIRHCAQAHELLITAVTTTYFNDEILKAYTSRRAMAMTTTMAMMMTNVNNMASGASARHFHIASRSGNNNNNYWQQGTMSIGRRGLVREHTTYSHRVAQW
jgi:hypothetical protein